MNEANSSDDSSSVTTTNEIAVEEGAEDPITCTSCNWDAKMKKVTCWNGTEKIPVNECEVFN